MDENRADYDELHTEADKLIQSWTNLTDGVADLLAQRADVKILAKGWLGFDDSHHYGDAVLRALSDQNKENCGNCCVCLGGCREAHAQGYRPPVCDHRSPE